MLWAAEKDAGGGILKSAQDFFENTVYSIALQSKTDACSFKKDGKCEHSLIWFGEMVGERFLVGPLQMEQNWQI